MPNPASDFLYVQQNLGIINSFEIFSMDGKLVTKETENEAIARLEINTQNLKAGVYLLRINYSDRAETRKFVVKR
jgi:hypothetical protein